MSEFDLYDEYEDDEYEDDIPGLEPGEPGDCSLCHITVEEPGEFWISTTYKYGGKPFYEGFGKNSIKVVVDIPFTQESEIREVEAEAGIEHEFSPFEIKNVVSQSHNQRSIPSNEGYTWKEVLND